MSSASTIRTPDVTGDGCEGTIATACCVIFGGETGMTVYVSYTTPNGTTTDEASCFVSNTCDAELDEGVEPGAPRFSKAS